MAEQIKDFPIAHVFPYTRRAFFNANEFGKEHADDVKKKAYNGTTFTIELNNGETHVFMSNTTYTKYLAIGRTYYLNGTLCHSGYPARMEG